MAIGAPPLRYPARSNPGLYVIDEDHLANPVALRCGDRLELHLCNPGDPAAPRPAPLRIEGAQILIALKLDNPVRGGIHVLAFDAVEPGQARLLVDPGGGRDPIGIDVRVTP